MSRLPQLVLRDHALSMFRPGGTPLHPLLQRSFRHDGSSRNEALWCDAVDRLLPAALMGLCEHVSLVELHATLVPWVREQLVKSADEATAHAIMDSVSAYVEGPDDVAALPSDVRHVSFAAHWDEVFVLSAFPTSSPAAMQVRSDLIIDECVARNVRSNAVVLGAASCPFRKEANFAGAADEALRLVRGGCSTVTFDDTAAANDAEGVEIVLKTAIAHGLNPGQELGIAVRPGPAVGNIVERACGVGVRQFSTASMSYQQDYANALVTSRALLAAAVQVLGGIEEETLDALQKLGDATGGLARRCSAATQ